MSGDLLFLWVVSFAGCLLVALTFFATVNPWQPPTTRLQLHDWHFWLKPIRIEDLPREGDVDLREKEGTHERVKPRELRFLGLVFGLAASFAAPFIAYLLFDPYLHPVLACTVWSAAMLVGPLLGNWLAYEKQFVLRRHFVAWCYMVMFCAYLGLERIVGASYAREFVTHVPGTSSPLLDPKLVMVGVVLFCWTGASREFHSWKSDIRDVREAAGMGPIPPEWSPHVATNDLAAALSALVIVLRFV